MTAVLFLAAAVGAGSYMLSKARIFSFLRQYVIKKRMNPRPFGKGFWVWLNELVNCPFCVSVWLSAGAVAVYRPRVVRMFAPVDFLVETLALSAGAMLAVLVIRKALEVPK